MAQTFLITWSKGKVTSALIESLLREQLGMFRLPQVETGTLTVKELTDNGENGESCELLDYDPNYRP